MKTNIGEINNTIRYDGSRVLSVLAKGSINTTTQSTVGLLQNSTSGINNYTIIGVAN